MKILDKIFRTDWLVFGAVYGMIAFLASLIAAAIFAVVLTPIIPELSAMITANEPTASLLSKVEIPIIGGIIAGLCIFGGLFISAIFSSIYWWVSSWLYDISKITPLWLFARKLPTTMKMVYAGLLIPAVFLLFAIFLNLIDINFVAIAVNLLKFGIQIAWLLALVYATWFALKIVRMKLPVEK